jgi:hypothetical protein
MTKIGFEFEFVSMLNEDEITEKLREYGIKINNNLGYKAWQLDHDMSVKSRKSNIYFSYGHELISPPMSTKRAFKMLAVVFKFMQDIKAETNTTTGLHVNMDIGKRATRRIDPTKLVTLVDDEKVAKRYNRSRAYYALPNKSKIRQQAKYWNNLKNKPCKLVDYVKQWGLTTTQLEEKYSAINFGNQEDCGYLEFRMIGNRGYEKRYKEIAKDIVHFETCMHKAADKTAGNKAVSRRLNKMAA